MLDRIISEESQIGRERVLKWRQLVDECCIKCKISRHSKILKQKKSMTLWKNEWLVSAQSFADQLRVVFSSKFPGRNFELEPGEPQAFGLEPPDDLSAEAALDPVRLDHHERQLVHRRPDSKNSLVGNQSAIQSRRLVRKVFRVQRLSAFQKEVRCW